MLHRDWYWEFWHQTNNNPNIHIPPDQLDLFQMFMFAWFPVYVVDDENYPADFELSFANSWENTLSAKYGRDKVESKYTSQERREWLSTYIIYGWQRTQLPLDAPVPSDDCLYYDAFQEPQCNGSCRVTQP